MPGRCACRQGGVAPHAGSPTPAPPRRLPTPGACEELEAHQARLLVLELLHEIDIDARAVLIAHDIDGNPMAEVAEQRGIPLSTVYRWRTRAKAQLREACSQHRAGAGAT